MLEPSWWPADVEEISHCVARFSSGRAHYEIESTRRDGVPVGVIGHFEAPGGRSPKEWLDGEWTEPRELAHMRGLIGRAGTPPVLQAVIYHQQLEIHFDRLRHRGRDHERGYEPPPSQCQLVLHVHPLCPQMGTSARRKRSGGLIVDQAWSGAGTGCRWWWAVIASVRYVCSRRCCSRQVSRIVRSRSTAWLP